MERALKSTNVVEKNAAMETARAKTGINKVNEELEYLQKRSMKHLYLLSIKCSSTRINILKVKKMKNPLFEN